MGRKIYVASSWRNPLQPEVVAALRHAGHEVYDFRHPAPGNDGFSWSEIDPNWRHWTPEQFVEALKHPIADRGYGFDKQGLDWCDTCLLVLPCGRSAHLEAGYTIGQGKPTAFIMFGPEEPELMYKLGAAVLSGVLEALEWVSSLAPGVDHPAGALRWQVDAPWDSGPWFESAADAAEFIAEHESSVGPTFAPEELQGLVAQGQRIERNDWSITVIFVPADRLQDEWEGW